MPEEVGNQCPLENIAAEKLMPPLTGPLVLSLEEAIILTLRNNQGPPGASTSTRNQRCFEKIERGTFDPELFIEAQS